MKSIMAFSDAECAKTLNETKQNYININSVFYQTNSQLLKPPNFFYTLLQCSVIWFMKP